MEKFWLGRRAHEGLSFIMKKNYQRGKSVTTACLSLLLVAFIFLFVSTPSPALNSPEASGLLGYFIVSPLNSLLLLADNQQLNGWSSSQTLSPGSSAGRGIIHMAKQSIQRLWSHCRLAVWPSASSLWAWVAEAGRGRVRLLWRHKLGLFIKWRMTSQQRFGSRGCQEGVNCHMASREHKVLLFFCVPPAIPASKLGL